MSAALLITCTGRLLGGERVGIGVPFTRYSVPPLNSKVLLALDATAGAFLTFSAVVAAGTAAAA